MSTSPNHSSAAPTNAAPHSAANGSEQQQQQQQQQHLTPDQLAAQLQAASLSGHFPAGASGPPPNAASQPTPAANASIYVGELDPNITEAMLFEMFSLVGPVSSIRVCRDAVTRRSLGYAYVNFHNIADGERALETLNYTLVKGKACRLMWSQRDPALRRTGNGNVFIKNLDPSIDNKALHDTFTAFGNILSCKVVTEDGVSKGFGFVHYETYEAAENAIQNVNGMLLNDKKVFVGHHVPKKERQSKAEEMKAQFTNVYVKNLDTSITGDEVREKFEAFGTVTSCVVSTDEEGKSRGFGFVNFENHEDASRAVDALNDQEWNEKKLLVTRAQKKGEREDELKRQYESAKMEKLNKYQGVNLYVKNLDDEIDDEQLHSAFASYGNITSTKVMRDEKGTSKGFGFVCFSSPDEATKAVTELNGHILGRKPLYVALAQRKDVRRNQLEAQVAQRSQLQLQQAAVQGGMPAGPMYGGAPMFYAGPQPPFAQGRGFPPVQGGMQPRPRWAPAGQQQPMMAGIPPQGYPNMPMQYPNMMGNNMPNNRPPRGPRQNNGNFQNGNLNTNHRGGPIQQNRPQGPPPTHSGKDAGAPPPPRSGPPASRGGGGNGGSGYKYNANTRNQPSASPNESASQSAAGAAPIHQQTFEANGQLTAAALANAPPEQQKQMLGEALYPLIAAREPDLAGKITGMLLEMDNGELLHLTENSAALEKKLREAVAVLSRHQPSAQN